MGQAEKKDFTIKEDGTIVRDSASSKINQMKKKLSSGNNDNNPTSKKRGKNSLSWLAALLIIGIIIGSLIIFNNKDSSYDSTVNIDSNKDKEEKFTEEEYSPKHEEFQTRQFSMSEERDNLTNLEIDIDYPVKGDDALVYSIRKFINQTLSSKMAETPYDGDLSDGENLVKYYYDCAASNPEMDIEIEFEVLYESDKFVSYFYMIDSYLEGDVHGSDAIGGATFVKGDGSIVDWGMFKNDSEMQYQIKKGMESFYGSGNYNNDYTPFPKVSPVLLKDAVKFFYNRYELGGSYADGTPTFSIPYADIKNQMKSTVVELIE